MNCNKPYEQLFEDEKIEVGDIISIDSISNKVRLARDGFLKEDKQVIRYM